MTAPATLPCSFWSIVAAGTRLSCSPETTETAFAAFWLETTVAVPVTTWVSSCRTSLSSVMATSLCPPATGTT
jgi:hypothetical protein